MEYFSRFMATLMLIIMSPLLLLISFLSLVFQGNPVLFKQERIGYAYHPFMLVKFRSMIKNNGNNKITNAGDNRITLWGKLLRTLKLDELPQLWNIVKGDMRFIGPRPEVQEFVRSNDFSFLTIIKPGLTDFSSILFRNESDILSHSGGIEKYPKLLELKVELGHLYAKHKNFLLDIKLVLLTIVAIFFPKTAVTLVKKYFIEQYKPDLMPAINEWIK